MVKPMERCMCTWMWIQ